MKGGREAQRAAGADRRADVTDTGSMRKLEVKKSGVECSDSVRRYCRLKEEERKY